MSKLKSITIEEDDKIQVSKSIRYALNHSSYYQHIKVEEKEKVIYTYYE